MIVAASLGAQVWHVVCSIAKGFANVGFTGSLILTVVLAIPVFAYAKKRPVGAELTWGQAMIAACYVTFGLFWAFGVVPHQWLNYAEGSLGMRSDAILAGPGSTGWLTGIPVRISKATVSDIVATMIYGAMFTQAIAMWAVWQNRGKAKTEEVATSTYGRPLVKA